MIILYKKQEKTSQYTGVSWHKKSKRWHVLIHLNGGKKKYGGYFSDELDAGKRVNQLCEELGIPIQNPTINTTTVPNDQSQEKEMKSQYKCVYWNKKHKKWYVQVSLKGQKQMFGGSFNDELDA